MTPEEKALLEKTLTLTEENNTILKSMRRTQRLSTFMRLFYWTLIIGLSIVGYFSAQTYLRSILGAFGDEGTGAQSPSLIDQYRALLEQ